MAFTEQNKADAYLFFVLAFNAAPGTVYGGQIVEAYESGMTTAEIVDQYVTKDAFKAIYPDSQTNAQFAAALVNNVASANNPPAAKTAAIADIETALAAGWTKAQVITQIIGNLAAKTVADAEWGVTVAQLNNKIAVAKVLTEGEKALATTDVALLTTPLANVTEDVKTVESAINGAGSLAAKLANLAAANKAVATFAAALDLDANGEADNWKSDEVSDKVTADVATKADAVEVEVTGWKAAVTTEQKAALVAKAKADAALIVTQAKQALIEAKESATEGKVTATNIGQFKALNANKEAAAKAVDVAVAELAGAGAKLSKLIGDDLNASDDGVIEGYTVLDGETLKVASTVTDATVKAAVTSWISAFNADAAAADALTAATSAKSAFAEQLGVGKINLIGDVLDNEKAVSDAEKLIPAIDKVLSAYTAAKSNDTTLKALLDAVADAKQAFEDAGLPEPVEVDGLKVATVGDDTYLVGEGTIGGFGVLGKDVIYAGSTYKLNTTGDLTKGDDAALEVFFKANGSNTDVYVEQKAFGSSATGTEDLVKITLTGVTADKLVFEDGFITLA